MKKQIFTLMITAFLTGCRSERPVYNYASYQYNKEVIAKLPLYDSIVQVIRQNHPSLWKHLDDNSYYRFVHVDDSSRLYDHMPTEAAAKVHRYFSQIGL